MVRRGLTVAAVLEGLSPALREALLARNPHLRAPMTQAQERGALVEAHARRDGDSVILLAKGLRLDATLNARAHWSQTARKRAKERAVIDAALAHVNRTEGPWRITISRIGPRRMDDDNVTASAKGVRDAVARWLGIDDGDERATWITRAEVARGYAVRVQVDTQGRDNGETG